jgi:hypothetical protein
MYGLREFVGNRGGFRGYRGIWGDVVWARREVAFFLFIGGQITSDVSVLILHLRCIMLTPLYIVVNSFTYTTTRSIRNENRLKSTKFVTFFYSYLYHPRDF